MKRVVILGGVLLALIFFLCFHVHNLSEKDRLEGLEKLFDEVKSSK